MIYLSNHSNVLYLSYHSNVLYVSNHINVLYLSYYSNVLYVSYHSNVLYLSYHSNKLYLRDSQTGRRDCSGGARQWTLPTAILRSSPGSNNNYLSLLTSIFVCIDNKRINGWSYRGRMCHINNIFMHRGPMT